MFPIKRTIETETYGVTVDWLKDFANKIAAKASVPPAPFLLTSSTEKFATIEDKMADMKARVGFDNLTRKQNGNDEAVVKSAKSKNTKRKPSKERIEKLKNVLKFITDMMAAEPHLLEPEIRSRCQCSDLGFDELRIHPDKLSKFIEKHRGPQSEVAVVYSAPAQGTANYEVDVADYYSHSSPNIR